MKYGLIYYKNTENLGDDILSYAGKQFLPQVDYYIDRENMDLFLPEEKEYVAAILNGWYIHYSYTFPPSPYLIPFFTGAHFNRDTLIYGDYSYLDEYAVDYMKKFAPIGCRDQHTADVLNEKGIESYFSGCLTLTLRKFQDVEPNHAVILTDVSERVRKYIENLLNGKHVIPWTHRFTKEEKGWDSWEKREERLEKYLRAYQGADLVVTTRLHCALPCIALGTPVILIVNRNDDYHDRIESFSEFCACFSEEELLGGLADSVLVNYPNNQTPHQLVEEMKKGVNQFIADMSSHPQDIARLPEISLYREMYIDRSNSMRRALEALLVKQDIMVHNFACERQKDMEMMESVMALAKKVADKI